MKNIQLGIISLASVLIFSCSSSKNTLTHQSPTLKPIKFHINLNDLSNDTFKVTVSLEQLSKENNIYYFAATAPGTYSTMDIGRFVQSFSAYDNKGNIITTNQIATNQFEIETPEKVHTIKYAIAETFDTPVNEYLILPMSGTSLEKDHAFINGQAVFGYFKGMQNHAINIQLDYPKTWSSGTALRKESDHSYSAKNYDQVVDSPILLGNLTKSTLNVSGTNVDILTYSEQGLINSDMILGSLKDILTSADKYLDGLPVDHYTFLFFFETNNQEPKGAWEHSYSSAYTFNEEPWSQVSQSVIDAASHEFFHIVTPLNIHSEIIHEFNFVQPIASKHLWLYEGVTEWASHQMLFRTGQKSLDEYLYEQTKKIYISNNYFNNNISLLDLSLNAFTKNSLEQYPNIYMKGALTASLLDIYLLELSNGKKGLIDVIKELSKTYGPDQPFNDETFFEDFSKFTGHSEIMNFINLYIKDATPLPIKEYYEKIGISYDPNSLSFTLNKNATKSQIELRNKWMKPL